MSSKIIPAAFVLAATLLAGGCSDPVGPGQPAEIETAVGAAYRTGSTEVVLIDRTGTRYVTYSLRTRTFSSARSVKDLDVGGVFEAIGATGNHRDQGKTYVLSHGHVSTYERSSGTFTRPDELGKALPTAPFTGSSAATPAANTDRTFFFDEAGTRYALWDYRNNTWTSPQDFATEFGGGGAPIESVGAAFTTSGGSYYLFDLTGTRYTIYAGNGRFAPVQSVTELGDGSLRF